MGVLDRLWTGIGDLLLGRVPLQSVVWLGYSLRGEVAPNEEVRRAFATGLAAGLRQARTQRTARPEAGQ